MKFEDLQSQWQDHKAPEKTDLALTHDSIMNRIIRLQRKTIFASLGVSVSFAFVFIAMGFIWKNTGPHAWYYHLGMSLIYIDMILALVFIWSLVISYKNRDLNLSSIDFIDQAIRKLKRRRLVYRTVIPAYLLILILGINLVYLESLINMDTLNRILTHVLISVITFGGGMLAVIIGRKRDKKLVIPLLQELKSIKTGLESEPSPDN